MELLRCHGVTVEIPPGLSDGARVAFVEDFARETPEGLAPDEAALHVQIFLAQHAPSPLSSADAGGAAGAPAVAPDAGAARPGESSAASLADSLED